QPGRGPADVAGGDGDVDIGGERPREEDAEHRAPARLHRSPLDDALPAVAYHGDRDVATDRDLGDLGPDGVGAVGAHVVDAGDDVALPEGTLEVARLIQPR